MPFYLSPNVFKQQSKTLVKNWPFAGVTTAHVRNVLSQLYGYKNNHHYQQSLKNQAGTPLVPCSPESVVQHYGLWVKRLAALGPMNEIQAKKLVHHIWRAYIDERIDASAKLYRCTFTFRGDCAIFIDEALRQQPVVYAFDDKPSVKDAIESLGVPHPEVLAIQVGERFVDFHYKVMDGDDITVFSMPDMPDDTLLSASNGAPIDIVRLPYLPNAPDNTDDTDNAQKSTKLTFLLDVHLGGLARYLRMAGFDCLFESTDYGDAVLAEMAHREDWVLLTRDIHLLKRGKVKYGRWIRNTQPEKQFHEVVKHYNLYAQFQPFSLCIKCNGRIEPVQKSAVESLVPEKVYRNIADFKQCSQCHQVYWQGSHYEKILAILARAQGESGESADNGDAQGGKAHE